MSETADLKQVVHEMQPLKNTELYLQGIKVGVLVAFKETPDKINTAKVINTAKQRRKLKLETAYGMQFVVSFDDVLWVKTGKYWPKHIYTILQAQKGARRKERVGNGQPRECEEAGSH